MTLNDVCLFLLGAVVAAICVRAVRIVLKLRRLRSKVSHVERGPLLCDCPFCTAGRSAPPMSKEHAERLQRAIGLVGGGITQAVVLSTPTVTADGVAPPVFLIVVNQPLFAQAVLPALQQTQKGG